MKAGTYQSGGWMELVANHPPCMQLYSFIIMQSILLSVSGGQILKIFLEAYAPDLLVKIC